MSDQQQGAALYQHTQQGYLTLVVLAFATAVQVGTFAKAVAEHRPRRWLQVPPIMLTAGLACVLSSLTVEVTRSALIVSFRRGFLRRTIDLGEIRSVEPTTVSWCWGLGVHLTPKGWLYNVQGRHAVRVELTDGRSLAIGTDEPERLAAAIEAIRPVH